jgi:hypothetical protein
MTGQIGAPIKRVHVSSLFGKIIRLRFTYPPGQCTHPVHNRFFVTESSPQINRLPWPAQFLTTVLRLAGLFGYHHAIHG